ncbi:MAG TPA: response regulator [Thermomicrobiales bacterium]|jgi:DNA-binding response OmpR family regulator|nr:response regulator [Thermomicrobiales bacterium]
MSEQSSTSTQHHIVAINNSAAVLALFQDLLSEEGYQVTTRVWVDRNTPEIAELKPDLIILDYQWATDDEGWSLLQMLRLAPGTTEIPILLCTGAITHVEDTRGHLHDMQIEVLYKPFNLDQLLGLIRSMLHTRFTSEAVSHDA